VDIAKRFGPLVALDGVHLTAVEGEVHAVLGENGAGKTTLMNVLAGMLRPERGRIVIEGSEAHFHTPREAGAAGVGMVHQHFTLVPDMTVLENVALGVRSAGRGFRFPRDRIRRRITDLIHRTGLAADPEAFVRDLTVGGRQRVEILKLLFRDPRILVMDEPTAVLAPQEVSQLFEILRSLAAEGRTVLLIAHKLDEVLAVADRVTVLRDGATVLTAPRQEVDPGVLARAMVGRPLATVERSEEEVEGDSVAQLSGVWVAGARGEASLRGVDLVVRRGGIVGVGGVEGNGQRELALVLSGRLSPDRGTASLPDDSGLIPQDRCHEGVIPEFSLTENMALALHRRPRFRIGPLLRWALIRDETRVAMLRFGVRARGASTLAGTLSGGNQQKLIVSRELSRRPDLLVAENPTRGLDIAATEFVHREIFELRAGPIPNAGRGRAGLLESTRVSGHRPGVVLISTDLDDVLALSDRIFVMVRGKLVEVPPEMRNREGMGSLMLAGGASEGRRGESAP
jgi:simple sugar transport system ATP-binding protein